MIKRNGMFETNSSSTHALCIGRGEMEDIYELKQLLAYSQDWCAGCADLIRESDYMKVVRKEHNQSKYSCEDSNFMYRTINKTASYKNRFIKLQRYNNIGRMFRIYSSWYSKINYLWTGLTMYANYNKKYVPLVRLFLERLYSLSEFGVKLYFQDIKFVKPYKKDIVKTTYNEGILFSIPDHTIIPKEMKNNPDGCENINNMGTYFYGEYSFGYFPIKEVSIILSDEKLFWNLIGGQSVIYTGSDENLKAFQDLDFSNYKYVLVGGSDSSDCRSTNIFAFKPTPKIGEYINGNYKTILYKDGTRTRELVPHDVFYDQCRFKQELFTQKEIDIMQPEFPESIDLKITNYCENNCKYCYAQSNKKGKHADINFLYSVIDGMRPHTEIALGGGNVMKYPQLEELLKYGKSKDVICNITVKDVDFIKNIDIIDKYYKNKLITAIGISPTTWETLQKALKLATNQYIYNTVTHLILGIHDPDMLQIATENNSSPLFLGFKSVGLGSEYKSKNKSKIEQNIEDISNLLYTHEIYNFGTGKIAFDNLAIQQLKLDMTKEEYKEFYQGEDGKFSFYIDGVEEVYSKNSMSPENEQHMFISIDDCMNTLRDERDDIYGSIS